MSRSQTVFVKGDGVTLRSVDQAAEDQLAKKSVSLSDHADSLNVSIASLALILATVLYRLLDTKHTMRDTTVV